MDMNIDSQPAPDDELTVSIDGASGDALLERIDEIDVATQAAAAQLPFPVKIDADMGGTFAFHIDLGTPRDSDNPDDPHAIAGMDPNDENLPWWYSDDGGMRNIESPHGFDTDPKTVAQWIVDQAARHDLVGDIGPGPIARARCACRNRPPRRYCQHGHPAGLNTRTIAGRAPH